MGAHLYLDQTRYTITIMNDILSKEIKPGILKDYIGSHIEELASVVVLLFILSPAAETIVCLFDNAERLFHLTAYPFIILNIVQPAAKLIGYPLLVVYILKKRDEGISFREVLSYNRAYAFFGIMVLWMILASIITGTVGNWFWGDAYRNEPLSFVISYFVTFFFCASLISRSDLKEKLITASVTVSILLCVYSVPFHYYLQSKGVTMFPYATGIFSQHNHYGYYLAVHVMLSAALFALGEHRITRMIAFAGLITNTIVLSLNNTFGAWLACLATFFFQIIVLAIIGKRLHMRSLAALAVFLTVTFIMGFCTDNVFSSLAQFFTDLNNVLKDPENADSAGSTRWKLWKFTAGKISERPLFGFGNEGIDEALNAATGSTRPHNEFLQYAAFYGIPSAVFYIAGILSVYIRGYKNRNYIDCISLVALTGAFAYLFSSLFGNTMYYTTPFFFIFLGLGYSCSNADRHKSQFDVHS